MLLGTMVQGHGHTLSPTHLCWVCCQKEKIPLVVQRMRVAGGERWEQSDVPFFWPWVTGTGGDGPHISRNRCFLLENWNKNHKIREGVRLGGTSGGRRVQGSAQEGHLQPVAQECVQTGKFTVFFSLWKLNIIEEKMNYLICKLIKLHRMLNVDSILLNEGILQ